MRIGIARDQRRRRYMEDRHTAGDVAGGTVLGVFDGHGGAAVAEHAAAEALAAIHAALARGLDGEPLWRAVFAGLDADAQECGSTATLVLVRGSEVSAAWVGDSRALLVSATGREVLTPDHRLGRVDEHRRVTAAGAMILPPYACDPRTGNGLMVTRSLGDRALRSIGIVADPEVARARAGPGAVGVVVATDGLWDVVDEDRAAGVCRTLDPQAAAGRLVAEVAERDGRDNVTVLVARF